ncbi:hypothetical protein ACJX0J_034578, partial [Zea mays]
FNGILSSFIAILFLLIVTMLGLYGMNNMFTHAPHVFYKHLISMLALESIFCALSSLLLAIDTKQDQKLSILKKATESKKYIQEFIIIFIVKQHIAPTLTVLFLHQISIIEYPRGLDHFFSIFCALSSLLLAIDTKQDQKLSILFNH